MAIFQGSWAVRTLLDTRSSLFLEVGLNRIVSAFPQALSPTSTLNQIGESSKTGTPPWRMLVRFKTSSKCPFQHWKIPPVKVSSSPLQKLAGGKHCSPTLSRWPELLEGQSKIHCIANRTPPTCFNSNRSYSPSGLLIPVNCFKRSLGHLEEDRERGWSSDLNSEQPPPQLMLWTWPTWIQVGVNDLAKRRCSKMFPGHPHRCHLIWLYIMWLPTDSCAPKTDSHRSDGQNLNANHPSLTWSVPMPTTPMYHPIMSN